jgi:hypothetical protein
LLDVEKVMTKSRSSSINPSRREALVGVGAAAIAVGVGMSIAPAAASVIARVEGELTDMTGHWPAYNAPIGFGRPSASALITDPYDLIFA